MTPTPAAPSLPLRPHVEMAHVEMAHVHVAVCRYRRQSLACSLCREADEADEVLRGELMPTERLPDLPEHPGWSEMRRRPCPDRDHNPPTMMVFPPGHYRHTCPSCGAVQEFMVGTTSSLSAPR